MAPTAKPSYFCLKGIWETNFIIVLFALDYTHFRRVGPQSISISELGKSKAVATSAVQSGANPLDSLTSAIIACKYKHTERCLVLCASSTESNFYELADILTLAW